MQSLPWPIGLSVFPLSVTIRVFLVGIDNKSAVVMVVQDAIIVIVMVTVVSEAIIIRVQLGAVGDVWTVVSAVLVTVSIPTMDQFSFNLLSTQV